MGARARIPLLPRHQRRRLSRVSRLVAEQATTSRLSPAHSLQKCGADMGIDYDVFLVVGWEVTVPDDKGPDEYLDPICEKYNLRHVSGGNSYSGSHAYYLCLCDESPSIEEATAAIAAHADKEGELKKAGVKIGPFTIQAVGLIW